MSFESWVDRQIREAEERGDFTRLAGIGEPLPDERVPYDEMWWMKRKMTQEGLSVVASGSLGLRKEAEDALAEAAAAPSERMVRAVLEPVNKKIAANLRMPPPGPPLGREEIDIDAFLREWRAARSRDDRGALPAEGEPASEPVSKGSWLRRLRTRPDGGSHKSAAPAGRPEGSKDC
ncbi:DnaJ family domain-containing protein [Streptomyces xanthochromogenes]|uniref:DnaJ family domain-containing protein n=1 Tax=Streptomyces xanthochromogenes TaxID=67384 RepID=UPI0034241348